MVQTLRTWISACLETFALQARLQLFAVLARFGASSAPLAATSGADLGDQQPLLEKDGPVFDVDSSNSEDVVLSDGRKLGISYFGVQKDATATVFYLHGYPGCRLSCDMFFDAPAKRLGVRIIGIDRPGMGNSSPQPGRSLLDYPKDIRELAEHLHLKSYGIIGVSGGGPYALACAYGLPADQLKAVSIVVGMGPISVGIKGMNLSNQIIFLCLRYAPFLVRWLFGKVVAVINSMPVDKLVGLVSKSLSTSRLAKYLQGPDTESLSDPKFLHAMFDIYHEIYKQGVDGAMEDGRVLTSDWGFRLQDIRTDLPIQLWYSKKDTNVPLRMGEAIAAGLSSPPELIVKENESHLGLVRKYGGDALERLNEKL